MGGDGEITGDGQVQGDWCQQFFNQDVRPAVYHCMVLPWFTSLPNRLEKLFTTAKIIPAVNQIE